MAVKSTKKVSAKSKGQKAMDSYGIKQANKIINNKNASAGAKRRAQERINYIKKGK